MLLLNMDNTATSKPNGACVVLSVEKMRNGKRYFAHCRAPLSNLFTALKR